MLKTIPLLLKTNSAILTNLKGDWLVPEAGKTDKNYENDESFKNLKNANFVKKKLLKFVIFKI